MTGINIALEDTVLLGVFRKRSAKLLRWETRPHTGITHITILLRLSTGVGHPRSLQTGTSQSTKKSVMAKGNKGFPHNHCK